MLTVYPPYLEGELAATATALQSILATVRRESERRGSVLSFHRTEVQTLMLSARHCIADLDRLAALLGDSDLL